ncbi:TIGR03560 family F420-dependent LLM class oxidoreductase [Terrabacter sp. NPDC080008]|uniref:TIGR03560 family F420-dependent LLM class oxidoreductase n=1 Tax=Terrabacter sp. NPDC080008 TaxID=3155176 RepID=UPI00344B34E1
MLLGLQLMPTHAGEHGNEADTALALVRACDEAGLDSVWVADHFMFVDEEHPEREVPILESFVTLGAMAAVTERIRIGQLVVGAPYRNPALLAKACTTLDVLSHGRSIIGLGAAWHEPEFVAYGWPFPPLRERFQMLEEAVQVVDRMLTQRPASFSGKHFTIADAYNDPRPVQQPRPPILIGGSGEKVTLRLVAAYADMCNVAGDPAEVQRLFGVLAAHCEAVGRPVDQITRCNHVSILIAADEEELAARQEAHPDFAGIAGTPETVAERLREYAAVGSEYVTFTLADPQDVEAIRLIGKVVPEVADL